MNTRQFASNLQEIEEPVKLQESNVVIVFVVLFLKFMHFFALSLSSIGSNTSIRR